MNAIKAEALRLRIEAERKAAQTPMLGAVTSGAQLAYIAGLQRDIGRGQHLTPKPVAPVAEPAAITPDVLRAAFERAGVTMVQWLNTVTHAFGPEEPPEDLYWIAEKFYHYRPGPSTQPDVLARFYEQWDVIETLDAAGDGLAWRRHAPNLSKHVSSLCGAECFRLPANARLVRPL